MASNDPTVKWWPALTEVFLCYTMDPDETRPEED